MCMSPHPSLYPHLVVSGNMHTDAPLQGIYPRNILGMYPRNNQSYAQSYESIHNISVCEGGTKVKILCIQ